MTNIFQAMTTTPYDPDARCPKCGYDTVKTTYVPPRHYLAFPHLPCNPPQDEYLMRLCVRCDYRWRELVVPVEVREIEEEEEDESA